MVFEEQKQYKEELSSLGVRIHLKALIDPIGRSIKPIQVKHWLEEYLEQSLAISHMQRDEIELLKC